INQLDNEPSGLLVFGKTRRANRSLTEQFKNRAIRKLYFLVTDREVPAEEFTIKSSIVRAGERYVSRPVHAGANSAEPKFKLGASRDFGCWMLELPPVCHVLTAQPSSVPTPRIPLPALAAGF